MFSDFRDVVRINGFKGLFAGIVPYTCSHVVGAMDFDKFSDDDDEKMSLDVISYGLFFTTFNAF